VSKFASKTALRASISSPVTSTGRTTNREGAAAYSRDAKSELFLLAISNMVSENTFYEGASERDQRFRDLIHGVTLTDPGWVARFVPYLRDELNMRSASVVMAAEYALILRKAPDEIRAQAPSVRGVIAAALSRPDEPGEFIAYWKMATGRTTLPGGVQRGVADAVMALFNERAALKYDGSDRTIRLGDVLELVHPKARDAWQGDLFAYLLDRRHNPAEVRASLEQLPMIRARQELDAIPPVGRRTWLSSPDAGSALKAAGMTWESLSGWLGGPMNKAAWEAVIPSMGLMASIRNLRNFDQAGVSDSAIAPILAKLSDPEEVAKSRQLPFRFLSAYRAAPSLRWGHALEQALTASIANIPVLPGRTLVLVDTSSSMHAPFSKDGAVMRWDAAATFGIALGQRCELADVVSFSSAQFYYNDPAGSKTKQFDLNKGEALLRSLDRWTNEGYFLGGGTDTPGAVRKHFAGHSRVVIVTDEQATTGGDVGTCLPADVPLYTWNLAGYSAGHAPSGSANRHTFGGLTDAAFRMIPLLESGRSADWPF
jgi:hypothetical protein